jgi:excisionase family DNA binding protein
MQPVGQLLSTPEAAKRLGVAEVTIRRWAKAGHIRHVITPGGRMRFDPADLDAASITVEKTA